MKMQVLNPETGEQALPRKESLLTEAADATREQPEKQSSDSSRKRDFQTMVDQQTDSKVSANSPEIEKEGKRPRRKAQRKGVPRIDESPRQHNTDTKADVKSALQFLPKSKAKSKKPGKIDQPAPAVALVLPPPVLAETNFRPLDNQWLY